MTIGLGDACFAILIVICGLFGPCHRFLPERRDLSRAKKSVGRPTSLVVSRVRDAHRGARQHPSRILACLQRAVPALWAARYRRYTRSSSWPALDSSPGRRPGLAITGLFRPFWSFLLDCWRSRSSTWNACSCRRRSSGPSSSARGVLLVLRRRRGQWHDLLVERRGAAWLLVVFYAMFVISPKLIGFGDVRLAPVLGLSLGWLGWRYVILGLLCREPHRGHHRYRPHRQPPDVPSATDPLRGLPCAGVRVRGLRGPGAPPALYPVVSWPEEVLSERSPSAGLARPTPDPAGCGRRL